MLDINKIYNSYLDDLYSYASYLGFEKEVVMDAIHDVFYKLCANESILNDIVHIKPYLFRSLKNTLINLNKKSKETLGINHLLNYNDEQADTENIYISEEDKRLIRKKVEGMLASLTPKQHEIVYLRYVEEYSYDQIADILNITPSSCRKLIHKAMQNLRKKYPGSLLLFVFI